MSHNNQATLAPPKSTANNTKSSRLPAPTLFVGPPSRNASQLSITRTITNDASTRVGLNRQRSGHPRGQDIVEKEETTNNFNNNIPTIKKPSDKAIDSKWRELQSTLNEVELTAQSSTHVFGESHAAALEELRLAQIELARAWGRGDTGDADSPEDAPENGLSRPDVNRFQGAEEIAADRARVQQHGGPATRKRGDTVGSASTALTDESARTDDTENMTAGAQQLEEETAQDIRLASERRRVNEAYFRQVEDGVKDVVKKLEGVAEAMRGVEGESRSLWSGSSDRAESVRRGKSAAPADAG